MSATDAHSNSSCHCDDDPDDRLDTRLADAERSLLAAQHRLNLLRQREGSNAREHNARRLNAILPPELLLRVVRHIVAENPRAGPKLAAVCTSFRNIIHASPDLWQRIHITQHDPDPAEIARVYVARSGRRSFEVTLHLFAAEDPTLRGSEDTEREVAALHERLSEAREVLGRARSHPAPDEWPLALEAALQELHAYKTRATAAANWDASLARAMRILFSDFERCVRFEFRSTRRRPTELVADHIQSANAPRLRELVLHVDSNCRLPPIAPRHAPVLALADIQGVLADPVPRFSGLSQLRVVNGTFNAPSTPLAPLLGLLNANPDLQELCLQPLIPHPLPLPSASLPHVSLPRLTRLHLTHNARLERLMSHLSLPALAELTLAVQPGCNSAQLRPIFQGAPYPALHTLRLANLYVRGTTDLTSTLRQLATLRKLSISESTLCESVLRALADPNCCPLLEELVLDRCDGIALGAVMEIWRTRGDPLGARSSSPTDPGKEFRRAKDVQLNGSSHGTLRSLVVRNSSAPLADMELGEGVQVGV